MSSILFDCVWRSNSVVQQNSQNCCSIKFDCVQLLNILLDTPGTLQHITQSFRDDVVSDNDYVAETKGWQSEHWKAIEHVSLQLQHCNCKIV